MAQRWTDEMLDRQAEQIAVDRARMSEISQQIEALLEGQRMLVQIYQQEHDARVEADRRFNRFMERTERFMERTERFMERTEHVIVGQQQLNQQLGEAIEELRRLVRFSRENGSQN